MKNLSSFSKVQLVSISALVLAVVLFLTTAQFARFFTGAALLQILGRALEHVTTVAWIFIVFAVISAVLPFLVQGSRSTILRLISGVVCLVLFGLLGGLLVEESPRNMTFSAGYWVVLLLLIVSIGAIVKEQIEFKKDRR